MPVLQWIGKDKVINHHLDVPFHVLNQKYSFGEEDSSRPEGIASRRNKIIHGDNLLALKSLLPEYEGRVKCIYIANSSSDEACNRSHQTPGCCCSWFQIRKAC
ncbi:adenine-specific DNA-methyltransferase [Selenomonas ruminantium]|uniref:Adenine-specific DNA-methyltransferase n=2 Tax=Selenomonas ruminantium TaxID=971 RepID=A0A1I3C145_SELRU|nr:adenine-specific DNA-methyltransferase [Selenomonas ruminantium]